MFCALSHTTRAVRSCKGAYKKKNCSSHGQNKHWEQGRCIVSSRQGRYWLLVVLVFKVEDVEMVVLVL